MIVGEMAHTSRYFAYGSNLSLAQMARRCPGSRAGGPATLHGWRFRIMGRGYATIVREPGAVVHGLLWNLQAGDEKALDEYEGVAEGHYTKETVEVGVGAGKLKAMVYVGTDAAPGRPAAGYLERVTAAARDLGLPDAYVAELEGWQR